MNPFNALVHSIRRHGGFATREELEAIRGAAVLRFVGMCSEVGRGKPLRVGHLHGPRLPRLQPVI